MKRHWVLALATLVAIPQLALAQGDTGWGPRLHVTPFVGISPGIHQNGVATVFAGTTVADHRYQQQLSSALPLGLTVDYRFWNRFSVIAEGVYASRGSGSLLDYEDELVYPTDGSNFYMGKVALGMRLHEGEPDMQLNRGLNAMIYLGPAYIRDNDKIQVTTPISAIGSVNQWGLNMGADAELPLANNRMAFVLGLENYMVFWDETRYSTRVMAYLQQTNPKIDAVALSTSNTNFWILRVGLSYRFF